jgi:hypothetical protein
MNGDATEIGPIPISKLCREPMTQHSEPGRRRIHAPVAGAPAVKFGKKRGVEAVQARVGGAKEFRMSEADVGGEVFPGDRLPAQLEIDTESNRGGHDHLVTELRGEVGDVNQRRLERNGYPIVVPVESAVEVDQPPIGVQAGIHDNAELQELLTIGMKNLQQQVGASIRQQAQVDYVLETSFRHGWL